MNGWHCFLILVFLFKSGFAFAMDCSSIQSDVYQFFCEEQQRKSAGMYVPHYSYGARRQMAPQPQVAANSHVTSQAGGSYAAPQTEAGYTPPASQSNYCANCGYNYQQPSNIYRPQTGPQQPFQFQQPPAQARPHPFRPQGDYSSCSKPPPDRPKRIIIAFDGWLIGYSPFNNWLLQAGMYPFIPIGGAMLRNMVHPAIQQDPAGTHYEYFHEKSSIGSVNTAFKCALALATTGYRGRDGQIIYPTITVVGHSFGGAAAADVVRKLNSVGVSADFVSTADPRGRDLRGGFVNDRRYNGMWMNFEQQNDGLPGFSVAGANNYNLSRYGANHFNIPGHQVTQRLFQTYMRSMPRCKSNFSAPVERAYVNNCP
jgi:hypothetical protein